ncbi:asparagine synthetase B family protein [Spiribacter halobius]|uniref:asparagine synthetase B family protein n=1 Tax=Sediminicurvatus halobius TaxID=2182432 RepID=UPI0013048E75|nr:asparagine synthase C-terminal domain-containing protein [Spiribacter halobius]UEX77344.1 asparagine synthase C-terminal domain-containing protein [Spiribacter halobius]
MTPAELARRFRDETTELPGRLAGRFALALHDTERGNTLLACDRMGQEPMCYAVLEDRIVFGSRANSVAAEAGLDGEIGPQAVLDYLHFHVVPGPETIHPGVQRLLPGECLTVDGNGGVTVRRYWTPDWRPGEQGGGRDVADSLPEVLREVVADCLAEGEPPAAFLSGGTDSSTIAGLLAEHLGGEATAYSIGFAAEGYDEMEYARIVARHFGLRHREYYVTPEDVVDAVPRMATHFEQPFGNASAVPAYFCAAQARADGFTRMLAGDGGDELYGGNSRYAKQLLLGAYQGVPAPLRRGLVDPLLDNGLARGLPGIGKLARYVARANEPLPERLEAHNLLRRLGPARVLHEDVLAAADPEHPLALLRETWQGAQAEHLLHRLLTLDLRFVLADSDLPKVRGACGLAGVGVAFPMLDERVADLATRVPPWDKVHRGRLRIGFKRSLQGFLPPETLAKRKQGFGLPFGIWLAEHPGLRALAGDSLSTLKGRRLVRPQLIDELLTERHAEHAAYYGVMIWVLMMLEQWLEAREGYRAAAQARAAEGQA